MWSIFYAIKRSWTQHFVTHFSSLIVMTLTMSAVLFIALFMHNSQKVFDTWGKANRLTAYLSNETTEQQLVEVRSFLKNQKIVESFKMVTAEQAAEKFKRNFSRLSTQKLSQEKLAKFFPSYFEIKLNQEEAYSQGTAKLSQFSNTIKAQFPIFNNISYGKEWLDRYVSLLSQVRIVGYSLILLFLMASLLVCANVIKTLLFSRRDEIEILEFIGADEYSIYLPQIVNIFFLTLVSFLIAQVLILLIFSTMGPGGVISAEFQSQLEYLPYFQSLLLGGVFMGGGIIYSLFTILNLMPGRKQKQIFAEVFR